ncbi:DNA-directed RNA polymerase subunit beta [Durusdinium trenchii]|uniref:DNA-directed RNA polymerase subunit beta n=1 Tax=Durusdinium trenchii TaxID=1381693 RepID=A0ABP0Q304_9DINO
MEEEPSAVPRGLALEANAELPVFVSFTTGEYLELGEDLNCRKVLEAPGLPSLEACRSTGSGVLTLEFSGSLDSNTRYDLLVLGTLPSASKRIQSFQLQILPPGKVPEQLVQVPGALASFGLMAMVSSSGRESKHHAVKILPCQDSGETKWAAISDERVQYTFFISGALAAGSEIRIFSSPFIFSDEGLSFGGPCPGFDSSGLVNPVYGSCMVEMMPQDGRAGHNVLRLQLDQALSASTVYYLRMTVAKPKGQGSLGLWYAASKGQFYDKIIAAGPFFLPPPLFQLFTTLQEADSSYGARQSLQMTIFPRVNILGSTAAPDTLSVLSPLFLRIGSCELATTKPDAQLVGTSYEAYCRLTFQDNQNLYAHQSVTVTMQVTNPDATLPAEEWRVVFESAAAFSMAATWQGWPVITSLHQAFLMPMRMDYAQWNEIQIFFKPRSEASARALVVAPDSFRFELPCGFQVLSGFPDPGMTCSNPLGTVGHNLFAMQMPMAAAFQSETFYAAKLFPLRNPFPGSHTGSLDHLPWRIDLLSLQGTVLETSRNIPLGPFLQGFRLYPTAIMDFLVEAAVLKPLAQSAVTLRFRPAVSITSHGTRLRITAPFGYEWVIGAGRGQPTLSAESPVTLATVVYDPINAPAADPKNQLELTLVNPQIAAGVDLTLRGELFNAAIDPELHPDWRSANSWILEKFIEEIYEAGAGYLEYQYRFQAAVVPGYTLQAIIASISPWLPFPSSEPQPIMVTFRLGSTLAVPQGVFAAVQLTAPWGFVFPEECTVDRISPLHLEVDGFSPLPVGSIAACRGLNQSLDENNTEFQRLVASVSLTPGSILEKERVYAYYLEVMIPDPFPLENLWSLRTFRNDSAVTEASEAIQGFRPVGRFLSAKYHAGTADSGEDLRPGASENKVMFSVQASLTVPVGGELRITAPYRFTFAQNCLFSVHPAATFLAELEGVDRHQDLPRLHSCLGVQNAVRLTLSEPLDAALRYSFRLAVANPALPHPGDWPFAQNLWRFESLLDGIVLDAAEVKAFFLWSFTRSLIEPFVMGAGEQGVVSIELTPSLTLPPNGSLIINAPPGFLLPAEPCEGFEPDTGLAALPATSCERGSGGGIQLQLDDSSFIAAGSLVRFKLGVINPAVASAAEDWSVASVEQTELGEAFLEQNPAVTGYPVHLQIASFSLQPSSQHAGAESTIRFEFSLPEELGVFQVVSSTQESFIVLDMPPFFTVPTTSGQKSPSPFAAHFQAVNILLMERCAHFERISPDVQFFPVEANACLAQPGANSFRLRLSGKLDVGPSYVFDVMVSNPALTALRQKEIIQANYWQLRLVRHRDNVDYPAVAGRSTRGFQLLPLLQDTTITALVAPLPVQLLSLVRVAFRPVTALRAGDALRLSPPASILPLSEQCSVSDTGLPVDSVCGVDESGIFIRLQGNALVLGDSHVLAEVQINSGPLPLSIEENRWDITTLNALNITLDEAPNIQGFMIFPRLEATVIPKDLTSLSFANHADFIFSSPIPLPLGSSLHIEAPSGFRLYARTFAPQAPLPAVEAQQLNEAEVLVVLLAAVPRSQQQVFRLTIGNPAVSPPVNLWKLEVRNQNNTLALDRAIAGFLVRSSFNISYLEADVDEPLAENYIHVAVAVSQNLYADASGRSHQCTSQDKLCVFATWLEVVAPEGFTFQKTCGYWVLSRAGSPHRALPPGSLCLADSEQANIARVHLSLSLTAFTIYEFTLQVRNALSVPLENSWEIRAVQEGVARERDLVDGFPLRQMRSVRVTPVTTLAGAVDNTVTALLRSTRPVTPGSSVTVAAPEGFVFDTSEVASSFKQDRAPLILQDLIDQATPSGAAIRFYVSHQDYVAPNTFFYVSSRVRNPPATPASNYWYFYVQSQFQEHIDLRKFFPGFLISYRMPFFQVYPNNVPWELGTANDLSFLFVTNSAIFNGKRGISSSGPTSQWQLLLVAPSGFTFPTKGPFSEVCSDFQRWGGKDSYDQLPDDESLNCQIGNANAAVINVPTTFVNETRYSFRLNVTVAALQEDVALQQPWTLTVLENGEILHIGESPSPLLGTYYEARWFYVPGQSGT